MWDRTLSDLMDFDTVIQVHADGKITQRLDLHAPDLYQWENSDGTWELDFQGHGWELLRGFSGQYSYNGAMMHASEVIGGGLEAYIRETPGFYVALYPSCMDAEGNDVDADGWAVAYREEI